MDELFQNVREGAGPLIWSKGVELARQDAVTGDSESATEIVLRVKQQNGLSARVTLYVQDGDWQCSCNGPDDPCPHVAAAVISLRRAREQGHELPKSRVSSGKLVYRFAREPGGLRLDRVVTHDGAETKLDVALSALTSGRVKGPPLSATAEDMEVEVALDGERRGVLPARVFPKLLKALARVEGVTLDGAPVTIDPAPVGVVLEVKDEGPGVRVKGRQDPAIAELFANQVALCESGLRPVQLPQLTPLEQQLVRDGRFFGRQELGYLVGELLPGLQDKLKVDVSSSQLPGRTRAKPRLEVELVAKGEVLEATPLVVYGDPAVAEIRHGLLYAKGDAVPVRDLDEERKLKDECGRKLGLELDKTLALRGKEAVRFAQKLRQGGAPARGSGVAAFALGSELVPALDINENQFIMAFTAPGPVAGSDDRATAAGRGAADPARVLAAWARGESLVPLLGGGWAPLPSGWLARFGDRIRELLAAREAERDARGAASATLGATVPRALLPALADLAEATGATPPPALAQLRDKLASVDRIPPAPLPADLTATLRAYQKTGVDWLRFLRGLGFGGMLCDDMGLGKTLQAIAALTGRTLVVAPTSVVPNWLKELARFRPALKASLYHGPARVLDASADVVITTYAILRLDADRLAREAWDTIVLDEAQAIKNPDSQMARAARRLEAPFKLTLSGTPVENRLDDLWSQMQVVNPGLLGDRASFQERYARPIAQGDADAAARLRARIKPFVLRRLKRDVAPELPPRTDVVLHVELSPAERERYDLLRAATRKDVVAQLQTGGNVIEALEALLRLRQAACHPDLLPGVHGQPSAKLALLVETLEELVAEGHKALVFSQWTAYLDLMEPALQAAGLPFLRLDGGTADRAGVVARFQDAGGPPVLIMSLKAGGVGLNLTAADHVLLTDPWWNPAAEDQAADRAHRIGQDRPVLVQRLVAQDTVEERILELQEKKRALAAAAVDGAAAAASLTRDDLLALLD